MNPLARILLVEDDPRDAELALMALEGSNLANEVVRVEDGARALQYLRREGRFAGRPEINPAVVLLDQKLPKVDGMEVRREIRGDPTLRFIPVVILTSSREETDLVRGYELYVNAYVVKPVQFESFLKVAKDLEVFWALLNEPPPGSVARRG